MILIDNSDLTSSIKTNILKFGVGCFRFAIMQDFFFIFQIPLNLNLENIEIYGMLTTPL